MLSAIRKLAPLLSGLKKLLGSRLFKIVFMAVVTALANEYGVPPGFVQAALAALGLSF